MVSRRLQTRGGRTILVAAAAWALASSGDTAADDWPAFLGPAGSGVSAETGLLAAWPAGGPRVLWRRRVGEGYAAPAILGERLVFFHREGDEEVVECLAAATGETLWRHADPTSFVDPYGYNGGPRAAPVLADGRCVTLGAEGRLTCRELDSGGVLWRRSTAEEFDVPDAFFGVGSTPLVAGDRLFVIVGGHPRAGVVAFDVATGRTIWQAVGPGDFPAAPVRIQRDRPPEKLAAYASPVLATIRETRHLLCLMRPGLVSLDPETGDTRFAFWFRSRLHDSVNAAQPVVVGERIFLSAAYDTGAAMLDVAPDGRSVDARWRDELAMQNHWSTTIAHAGFLYGFSGRHEQEADFRCIRAGDGGVVWRTPDATATPPGASYGRGSAILAEGRFIVLGERGTLALVECSPERFREISRAALPELGHPCWTAPVLAGRRLFVTGCRREPAGREEYHLVCLDLAAE